MNMNIKNILVTGASGKLGRNLIPLLLQENYKVRAVRHRSPVGIEGVETVQGSVGDPDFIAGALEDMDAVCHLATCKEDRDNFLDTSIKGTFNLLDAARECGHIRQFLLAGGDAALGIFFYPNPEPLSEKSPLRAYPGYYAFSKVMEETMCGQYHIQYGLPVTVLRFSWIWDEDDVLAYMTFKPPHFGGPAWSGLAETAEQKKYFDKGLDGAGCLRHGDGRPFIRHVVGINDVTASCIRALNEPAAVGQTFNIAAPEAFDYAKLSAYISEKMNIPVVNFTNTEFHDFRIDITRARDILGFEPADDVYTMVDNALAFRAAGRARSAGHYSG